MIDDTHAQNRYNAARSAALAGAGKGIDKPPLDEQAKTRWRHQTIDWLKADLAHIRDEEELTKLSEPERKNWQVFWAEVAELLKKAEKS